MYLTQAQFFYFNGDKRELYRHLELYLDAYLAECKLMSYTCEQRSDTDRSLPVARAAGSHHIVAGNTKS